MCDPVLHEQYREAMNTNFSAKEAAMRSRSAAAARPGAVNSRRQFLARAAGFAVAAGQRRDLFTAPAQPVGSFEMRENFLPWHQPTKTGRKIPILFLGARASEEEKRQAWEAGAAGFLRTPFNEAALQHVIHAVLGRPVQPQPKNEL